MGPHARSDTSAVRGKETGDRNAESSFAYLAEPMAQEFSGGHLGLMPLTKPLGLWG
ncbi:MAG: hypothetical protein JHC22_07295 [Thermoproteus sp.]|nr:hypothetical protein [Thermoproteus sp.]